MFEFHRTYLIKILGRMWRRGNISRKKKLIKILRSNRSMIWIMRSILTKKTTRSTKFISKTNRNKKNLHPKHNHQSNRKGRK